VYTVTPYVENILGKFSLYRMIRFNHESYYRIMFNVEIKLHLSVVKKQSMSHFLRAFLDKEKE